MSEEANDTRTRRRLTEDEKQARLEAEVKAAEEEAEAKRQRAFDKHSGSVTALRAKAITALSRLSERAKLAKDTDLAERCLKAFELIAKE